MSQLSTIHKTMEDPQNRRFYFEVQSEKEDNICQSIWDKSEVLWKTCWGTQWELNEPNGNPLGTLREHSGNTMGTRKK